VKAFEQKLDHRRAHFGAVGKAQLLQRRRQLWQVAKRACVGSRRDSFADLQHVALFEPGNDTVELRGREVPAEDRADSAALKTREHLLLLAFIERFDLHPARRGGRQVFQVCDAGHG